MFYILIETAEGQFYQETDKGYTTRYTDLDGNTVANLGVNWVVDVNPIQPAWALPDTPVDVPVVPNIISRLAFRNRFTLAEKTAIYTAAETQVLVRIWLDDLTNSEYVNLSDPTTIAGVTALVSVGILTEARKNEILNA